MAHIYLASPHMSAEGYEQQYVKEAFDTNWIAPLGKNVNEFEKEFSAYVGAHDGAAAFCRYGSHSYALKAAGIKKGDIVFCQDLTFSATANPIIYEDAVPVFIDSDYETWNMSPEALERAFEKYPNVKAVLPVHLYGLPANMDRIMEICKAHHVPVIEDAAESLGTVYHGQKTGTFGDYGASPSMVIRLSLHPAEVCWSAIFRKKRQKSGWQRYVSGPPRQERKHAIMSIRKLVIIIV